MGVRCTQARFLGGNPNKLRKTSESTLCDRCIQEGYKPEDTLGLASDVTPDKESSAGRHQVCQFCGKPAVAAFTKREPLVPGDSEIDYDPGAGYFCEKHWEQLHEEGLIVGISSVDEPSQPPEEAFGEVFKAAKVMFDENITEEDLIIPTLAFANHASALPELRTIGERFNEIAPGRRIQEQFAQAFQKKFRGLSPVRISDNVLILESLWLCSDVSRYRDTTILKEIKIDVFMRSVKPEEVERRYEQALAQEGAPHDESREGSCGYRSSDTYLSIVVSPGKELD
jgi:hypothetical protein